MRIAERVIGEGRPYVIAELGVNHDGSPERALELTRLAHEAGADAIKLQLFRADMLMSRASALAAYQSEAGESDPVSMLRRLELSAAQMQPIVDLAHQLGMHAIVTVFSVQLVPEAQRLPWDAYKTASPDIVHRPLLEALAQTGRPLILSTGASTPAEISRAIGWLEPAHDRLALLQCVSSYPTPIDSSELGGITALRRLFSGPVGYSDHTSEVGTGALAAALGATILEKHFTYDTSAKGPDHRASLDAPALREYISRSMRPVDPGSWPAEKRVLEIEQDVRTVSRQSIVTARPMKSGEVIRREDLTFKRPGTGIAPFELENVIGRTLLCDLDPDRPLMPQHLTPR